VAVSLPDEDVFDNCCSTFNFRQDAVELILTNRLHVLKLTTVKKTNAKNGFIDKRLIVKMFRAQNNLLLPKTVYGVFPILESHAPYFCFYGTS